MYLEVSQRDKRGRVYGLGGAANELYRPSLSSSSQRSDASFAPTPLARATTQNKELRATVDKLERRNDWMMTMMQEKFGWVFPDEGCNPGPSPHRRDDLGDDGSGGSFGNPTVPPV